MYEHCLKWDLYPFYCPTNSFAERGVMHVYCQFCATVNTSFQASSEIAEDQAALLHSHMMIHESFLKHSKPSEIH